jgi:hypothetical protein
MTFNQAILHALREEFKQWCKNPHTTIEFNAMEFNKDKIHCELIFYASRFTYYYHVENDNIIITICWIFAKRIDHKLFNISDPTCFDQIINFTETFNFGPESRKSLGYSNEQYE